MVHCVCVITLIHGTLYTQHTHLGFKCRCTRGSLMHLQYQIDTHTRSHPGTCVCMQLMQPFKYVPHLVHIHKSIIYIGPWYIMRGKSPSGCGSRSIKFPCSFAGSGAEGVCEEQQFPPILCCLVSHHPCDSCALMKTVGL